jgi:hypothetical protein
MTTSGHAFFSPRQGPARGPNIVTALFGLLALAIFSTLYVLRRDIYFTVIDWWSFDPFKYPFLDLQYVQAQVKCWHMGIDVYAQNPCDPLHRVHDYSPLWLRLSPLGSTEPYADAIGLSLDGLVVLSLAALPRPRRWIDYIPVLLCVISPMTVYALERGNLDTLMFLLTIAAVVCMDRSFPLRLLGYAAIMLASLLKFYPFVLFILLLRERRRNFLLAAFAAACIMGGFALYYLDEIRRMVANIPRPSFFFDSFGAMQLPGGIAVLLPHLLGRADTAAQSPNISACLFLLLCGGTLAAACYLAQRTDFRTATQALTQRESLTLVAGAILICGCFFSGRSIGYREIMILMAIPGLAALARTSPTKMLSRIFRITTWVAVFVMMEQIPRRLINNWFVALTNKGGSLPTFAFWVFREACWWWLVAVLAAVLLRFALDSPPARAQPTAYPKNRSNQANVSSGDSSAI